MAQPTSTASLSVVDTIVVWLAPDGRIELLSGETTALLGLAESEIRQRPIGHWIRELAPGRYEQWWTEARKQGTFDSTVHLQNTELEGFRRRLRGRYIQRDGQEFMRCELEPLPTELTSSSLPQWGLLHSRGGAAQWKVSTGELHVTDALYQLLHGSSAPSVNPANSFIGLMQRVCKPPALRTLIGLVREAQREGRSRECTVDADLPERPGVPLRVYCEPLLRDGSTVSLRLWVQEQYTDEASGIDGGLPGLLAPLPLAHWWLTADGQITATSPAARRLLGEEDQPHPDIHALDADGLSTYWTTHRERAKDEPVILESVLRRPSGGVLPSRLQLRYLPTLPDAPYLLVAESSGPSALPRSGPDLPEESRFVADDRPETDLGIQIVYRSAQYGELMRQLRTVGPTNSTVLILGETGTGKELLARAVHEYSDRRSQPMVRVNCASLPENLAESELFGHEKGSFTGAYAQQIGKFEQADGGTIFLDEIGELSLNVQAKLLRVLQEGEIERIGGDRVRRVNVRVVAATNRDLREEVDRGRFRSDLYFRLNVFPVLNPPLRERPDDIVPLAEHLLRKHAQRLNRPVTRLSKKALQQLQQYSFPGNVRELENIIERGIILAQSNVLHLEHWQHEVPLGDVRSGTLPTFEEGQRTLIDRALRRTRGRVSGPGGAAELLALNPQTLYSKMRKLGIDRDDY